MNAEERKIAVAEWQNGLINSFRDPAGLISSRVHALFAAEAACGAQALSQLRGIMTLMDAFQNFTLQVAEECPPDLISGSGIKWTMLAATFHRFRSSLNVFYQGYCLDAAAALRGVFENSMYLGALLNGHISDWDIHPSITRSMSDDEIEKVSNKHRRALEQEIKVAMYGSNSGLLADEQREIDGFLKLMHLHVHRTQSLIIDMFSKWQKEKTVPSFLPTLDLRHASVYGTTSVFVGWCFLRSLVGSLCGNHSSQEVRNRFEVLDKSFLEYVRLTQSSSASATQSMIKVKFNFHV